MKPLPPPQPFSQEWDDPEAPSRRAEPARWTADQAAQLRQTAPSVSPWQVIAWQAAVGSALALVLGVIWYDSALAELGGWSGLAVGWSAGYGALTTVLPAAVLARGMRSPLSSLNAMSAAAGFMVWEMVKIGLSVAMLIAAPLLIPNLSWPALLAGLVVTLKVYWVAAVIKPKPQAK